MIRRVAVVFPFLLEAAHVGKDVFLLPEGLRRRGVEVEIHCPRAVPGVAWPLPVLEAGENGLASGRHYATRDLDAVVVYSFLHFPALLAAARAAGSLVVAKGDTTGESVVRAHPRATLVHALYNTPTTRERATAVLHWLARLGPLAPRDARELERVLRLADVTVIETEAARSAVDASLARSGRRVLANRVTVLRNPVSDRFTRAPVPTTRERLVVAVGRWDLAAKDASLLGRTLERFLDARPDHGAVVVGDGGARHFGRRVVLAGHLAADELAALLARARVVVTSSRWESYSLSSHEALAMGCTVVGPPLAPIRDILAQGPYGSLARRRSADGLADALVAEAAAWDRGLRDPVATASAWRDRLSVDAVGRELLTLLENEHRRRAG